MTSTIPIEPASLAAALAAVQASLPEVTKGETAKVEKKAGGFFKYTYADLAAVSRAILPRLGAVGLSWMTKPTLIDGKLMLEYKLMHSSGESETGVYPLPERGSPQEIGSAITYARRYCLCSVTGVAPADDDDAAEATAGYRHNQSAPPASGGPDEDWHSARPAGAADDERERANALRDWALRVERTGEEVRSALAKLNADHPGRAKTVVINEHGDDEQLAALLHRRIHDLGDRATTAAAPPSAENAQPAAEPAAETAPSASDDQSAPNADPPPPPPATPAPSAAETRDWALKPGRTADEIRGRIAQLQAEYPAIAKRKLQNEHGDQEELAAMLTRLAASAPAEPPPPPAPDAPPMATPEQLQRMHILFDELGFKGDVNRGARLDIVNNKILQLKQPVESTKNLTYAEAAKVIGVLQEKVNARRQAVPA